MILSSQIRKKFIEYFKSQGHRHIPSSPVVPHDDPTLLFTNAGMNQFKDLFLGKSKADYTRAVTSQKCIRVGGKHNDLDNVGHTSRHMTFFEMLGNFSFGDYFKKDAIRFAFEVTMKVFEFDFERLWVTIFLDDDEAFELWRNYVPEKRIVRLGEKDNFWSMGDLGPCGPCSELYFDKGEKFGHAKSILEDASGERYMEFWNLVFMQFNKEAGGKMSKLPNQSIDTGSGLERVISLKMGVDNLFETDIMQGLIQELSRISKVKYDKHNLELAPAFHVIADHIRSLSFAIADGAQPSNVERGYVLRKILRRAVRYSKRLNINEPFMAKLLPKLIELMGSDYPEIKIAENRIGEILTTEEENFIRTLKRGGNILSSIIEKSMKDPAKQLMGEDVFKLKDTYGFPLEEVLLIAKDTGLSVNLESYDLLEEAAKERSKKAHLTTHQVASTSIFESHVEKYGPSEFVGFEHNEAESTINGIVKDGQFVESIGPGEEGTLLLNKTPFYAEKGGQIGDMGTIFHHGAIFEVHGTTAPFPGIIAHSGKVSNGTFMLGEPVRSKVTEKRREKIKVHHTATHLLHKALQVVLGEHIKQAGSLVDPDRLRFDFNHHKSLSHEELAKVEHLVNKWILEGLPVHAYEKDYEEVKGDLEIKQFFGDKYGKVVRVIDIAGCSKELCGGTHAHNTKDLIVFRIIKEGSIGAGVRRIEAVAGYPAIFFLEEKEKALSHIAKLFETDSSKVVETTKAVSEELKALKLENKELKKLKLKQIVHALEKCTLSSGKYKLLIETIDCDPSDLFTVMQEVASQYHLDCALLLTIAQNGAPFAIKLSKELLSKGIKAQELIKELKPILGCTGGGKEDFAQGRLEHFKQLPQAKEFLSEKLKAL